MKTLTAVSFLLLASQLIFAQKNFEGEIVYRFIKPSEKKQSDFDTATITTYFGMQKIKMVLNNPEIFNNENYTAAVLDFTSGIIYLLNPAKNEFKTEKLDDFNSKRPPLVSLPGSNKSILAVPSSAFTTDTLIHGKDPYDIYWYSDTIYYSFGNINPAQHVLRRLGNGKNVCLGMMERQGEGKMKGYNVFYEAISIKHGSINKDLFEIPGNYKLETHHRNIKNPAEPVANDSSWQKVQEAANAAAEAVANMADSIVKATEQTKTKTKKNSPKKTTSKNTHSLPTKSTPIKPKD